MSDEPRCWELLQQAHALLDVLMAERLEERLVRLPPEGASLRAIERDAVLQALERAHWVQCDAAALLGISGRVMNHLIHHRHRIIQPPRSQMRRWRKGTA